MHDPHDVGVLQEHEPARVVVVGQRTERLGPERDLRVQSERAVEHRPGRVDGGHGVVTDSVDAAHAVDRDLLDQQLVDDLRIIV